MFNLIGKSLGRYHIIEPLGEGGMASVFKGFDTTLERYVAIKVIRTDKGQEEAFLHRFQREAKALARLDHPFILKVLDYGEQDGMPYLVMPFVPGGTLKGRMGQPIPAGQAAALLVPVARALEYAHHLNIIHRDVKPANILLTQTGEPLLSDFGIAKILDQGEQSTQLTATGVGIGTPDYMAPEQWMGTADPRTDIYALGVVFYEMVTGRRPYSADTPAAVLIKHLQDPLPEPKQIVPSLPDEAEQIILKALAKKPEDRYQEVGAFAAALERLAHRQESAIAVDPDATIDTPGALPVTRPGEPIKKPSFSPTVIDPAVKVGATVPGQVGQRSLPWLPIAGGIIILLVVIALIASGMLKPKEKNVPGTAVSSQNTGVTETAPAAAAQPTPTPPLASTKSQPPAAPTVEATPTEAVVPTKAPITAIEGYPQDVPLLADNNGDLIKTTQEGMRNYMFSTKLPFDEVVAFYKDGFSSEGWSLMNTTEQEGMLVLGYEKNDGTRMVMVSIMHQDDSVFINLMIQE